MEKVRTSTDMLIHNISIIDTLRLSHRLAELTYQLSLKLTKVMNPKHLKQKNIAMNLNRALCSLWGSYKQLESQLTKVSDISPRNWIFSLSFKYEIIWSNTGEKFNTDTKFKPGIMKEYFMHSLAGNLIYKLT